MRNLLLFLILSIGKVLAISSQEAQKVGEKIWQNECSGKFESLTHWGERENFPSLGIGHFIWYPVGQRDRFQEKFPDLLTFIQKQGIVLPSWLKTAEGCPWKSRQEFYDQIQSPQMKELRELLFDTRNLQALFIAERLEKALPKMTEKLSPTEKEKITAVFNRLASTPQGLYALIDYVNFKGEGTDPKETYQGQGWGLLQVLQGIPSSSNNVVADFAESAKKVLAQRVKNARMEKNEEKWLKGWFNRLETYQTVP
ncbi:MAG: hypothetical protein JSS10_02110 [Verrucomicrobia bacterium]|nr:hypothetical protein [Verrucomicrobiota bacterium]